jgi:hypothetical protein
MKGLFGGLLLACGILLMTVSGLCSAAVTVSGLSEAVRDPSLFLYPLIFGGVPFALGFGLFKAGKAVLRQQDRQPVDESATSPVAKIAEPPPDA